MLHIIIIMDVWTYIGIQQHNNNNLKIHSSTITITRGTHTHTVCSNVKSFLNSLSKLQTPKICIYNERKIYMFFALFVLIIMKNSSLMSFVFSSVMSIPFHLKAFTFICFNDGGLS